MSYDTVLDLGGGTAFPLTADLPSGLRTNSRFFRTDIGYACYYDGTRWLTQHEYEAPIVQYLTQLSATSSVTGSHRNRTDYALYVTNLALSYLVLTTNSATHNWTITTNMYTAVFASPTTIDTFSTSAATPSTWTAINRVPNTTQVPAVGGHFNIAATKNNSPGDLQITATVYYRLIIT